MTTIVFAAGLVVCLVGAVFLPILGILGYIAVYCIGAEGHWWYQPLSHFGLRSAFLLGLMSAVGAAIHFRKLRYGTTFVTTHEKLLLLFLAVVWVSTLMSPPTILAYTLVDHPSVKMLKIVVFILLLSHVVTTIKDMDRLMWVLILTALYLGVQAFTTSPVDFIMGRLETVGGVDFAESNFLAAYLAAMLPLIGLQFIRSRWVGRAVCLVSGAFAANAIILTRSRGAMVGVAVGMLAALLLAPRRYRLAIFAGTIVAAGAGYALTDPGFINRAQTITTDESQMDASGQGRVDMWRTSLRMLADHPLGVGAGNWPQTVGQYDPARAGRDAHDTYVRCYTELGLPGMAVFLAIIINAFLILRRIIKEAALLPAASQSHVVHLAYGLAVSLVIILACGITVSATYLEALWWLLALPVCMERAVANLKADLAIDLGPPSEDRARGAKTTPTKPRPGAAPVHTGTAR
jgi:O-antigen ligase